MPNKHQHSFVVDGQTNDQTLAIVVGAHLRAEIADRPLANWLRDRMTNEPSSAESARSWWPVVCTDLWYLNDSGLRDRPAIAIGDPSINAATAHLCTRLPTVMVVENSFRIHLDPEQIDPRACLWGVDAKATQAGVQAFAERYLAAFLAQTWESNP